MRTVILALAAVVVLAGGMASATAHGDPGAPSPKESPARAGMDVGGFEQVFGDAVEVAPGANGRATAVCPTGRVPVGGGGETSAFRIALTDTFGQGAVWIARGTNNGSAPESMRAFVVCTAPR
ncbi:hypothetical protein FGW37_04365 [Streptomyces rectiverticillatus]|uniref:hypothetical protein n=1 Tax=Streptomyces rectiverticillatus TaxID=173860 RepID=UPI0015C3FEC8|nr:hypothetical protein [Streptomyces rectiverticillatus]QLE70940.1 hypothetical protein FGW37_04365 [Streptomyces rectiverticillatus]